MWDVWVLDELIGESYRIATDVDDQTVSELRLIWNVKETVLFTIPVGFLAVRDPSFVNDINPVFEDCGS